MNLTLRRLDFTPTRTIGALYVDGQWECHTLEDVTREPGVKVPGQTAIPPGRYEVLITRSRRFDEDLPLLVNVPLFEGIRIHAGNTASDTEGCILVGQGRQADMITMSRRALIALMPKLRMGLEFGACWIEVG